MDDTDNLELLAELAALMPRVERALRGRLGEAAETPLLVPAAPRVRPPVGDEWLLVETWPPHPSICDFSDRVTWITPGEAQTLPRRSGGRYRGHSLRGPLLQGNVEV